MKIKRTYTAFFILSLSMTVALGQALPLRTQNCLHASETLEKIALAISKNDINLGRSLLLDEKLPLMHKTQLQGAMIFLQDVDKKSIDKAYILNLKQQYYLKCMAD